MTQTAIRLAVPEDIDAVLKLEREASAAAHWSRTQYEAIFRSDVPARLCLVTANGPVQAFLIAQTAGPEWELENIVVALSTRRQGLGRQILYALLESARRQRALAVWLEVRSSNAAARAFYRACGFMEVSTRPRYYQNPQEDAIIYTRKLEQKT